MPVHHLLFGNGEEWVRASDFRIAVEANRLPLLTPARFVPPWKRVAPRRTRRNSHLGRPRTASEATMNVSNSNGSLLAGLPMHPITAAQFRRGGESPDATEAAETEDAAVADSAVGGADSSAGAEHDLVVRASTEETVARPDVVAELPFSASTLDSTATVPLVPDGLRGSPAAARAFVSTRPIEAQIAAATREIETTHENSTRLLMQRQAISAIESAARARGHHGDSQVDLEKLEVRDADGTTMSAAAVLSRAGLLERFVRDDGRATVTVDALTNVSDELKAKGDEINGSTQLTMIQMQELMHQKNLLLQLATTELSSREQIERRIAENIR